MKAAEALRDNVNALMRERGWTSNKPVVEASGSRLSNGTLGRLRSEVGENVKLNVLDELAEVFGVAPAELLIDDASRHPASTEAVGLRAALYVVRARLLDSQDEASARAGDALKLLAMTPDSERAFNNALAALLPTHGEDSPPDAVGSALISEKGVASPTQNQLVATISGDKNEELEWKSRFKKISGTGPLKGPAAATTAMGVRAAQPKRGKR